MGVQDLMQEIGGIITDHTKEVGIIRSDPRDDMEVEVIRDRLQRRKRLKDFTKKFTRTILPPVPEEGRVIFLNIPMFGAPGDGKTTMALTMAMLIMENYGRDNVELSISDDLPTLVDRMRKPSQKPVRILIVDDALKHYASRGGTDKNAARAIALFTTLRHEYENASKNLNGIVYVLFTSQMYKLLDKVFRDGKPVFKTPLDSDRHEILNQLGVTTYWQQAFWDELNYIVREVEQGDTKALSRAVVKMRGYDEPGTVEFPMQEFTVLREILEEAAADGNEDAKEALEGNKLPIMYKRFEGIHYIEKKRLTPEQRQIELNRRTALYAKWFCKDNSGVDVKTVDGRNAVKEWLHDVTFTMEEEDGAVRMPSEDYMDIALSEKQYQVFLHQIESEYRRILTISQGLANSKGEFSQKKLIEKAAEILLDKGYNPFNKWDEKSFQALLYELPPDIRVEALRSQTKSSIKAMCLKKYIDLYGMPEKGSGGGGHSPNYADGVEAKVIETPQENGPMFNPDKADLLMQMIEQAPEYGKDYRGLSILKAQWCDETYGGEILSNDVVFSKTEGGNLFQREVLGYLPGEEVDRTMINKLKKHAERVVGPVLGLEYEKWVAKMLREGWVIPGVFDRAPIKEVQHGGGFGHDCDIIVVYEDGAKDYVSLKCWNRKESISLECDPSNPKKNHIYPEWSAKHAADQEGQNQDRVVVLVRNLFYDGFEAVRVFPTLINIEPTMNFNKHNSIGVMHWAEAIPSNTEQ